MNTVLLLPTAMNSSLNTKLAQTGLHSRVLTSTINGWFIAGASEYNLLQRIVETIGMPPDHMITNSASGSKYFARVTEGSRTDASGAASSYRLLSQEEFELRENTKVSTGKRCAPLIRPALYT